MNETFLDRLKAEYSKLLEDIEALQDFIMSRKCHQLSTGHKILLGKQKDHMGDLLDVLELRIELHSK